MDTYFHQRNWEDFVYQRLNEIIAKYRHDPDAYVVFDFDNTSCFMDIEDNFMIYLMEHLGYKLSPEEFHQVLTDDFFQKELASSFDARRPELTGENLAADIAEQYSYLYDHYISRSDKNEELLVSVKESPQYQTFRAKLRYFYTYVNTYFVRQPNKGWLTYLFAGHTVEELRQLAKASLKEALARPFEQVEFRSSDQLPGRSGEVRAFFQSGLRFPQELVDLFQVLHRSQISVYIVSASPKELVQVAVEEYGYHVPEDQIIGMVFQTSQEGKILPQMAPDSPITRGEGKTQAIQEVIMPRHHRREPIAMFGDSLGDYHMMKTFKHADLNVLFNRLMNDNFRNLVEQAVQQYRQPQAQFVLQGRDDNQGCLRRSPESIPFGKSSGGLYPENIQE